MRTRQVLLLLSGVLLFLLLLRAHLRARPDVLVLGDEPVTSRENCSLWTCFDLRRCYRNPHRLRVFVQPLLQVFLQVSALPCNTSQDGRRVSPIPSREFLLLRDIIIKSQYWTPSVSDACVVLPGVDFLNERRFEKDIALRTLDALSRRFFLRSPRSS